MEITKINVEVLRTNDGVVCCKNEYKQTCELFVDEDGFNNEVYCVLGGSPRYIKQPGERVGVYVPKTSGIDICPILDSLGE